MIPTDLTGWTIDLIESLLARKSLESDLFDYKRQLPHPKDKENKLRLYKACCAFANSAGGFLIFGVDDDRTLSPEQRLVGIPARVDFAEHFGAYPAHCTPTIYWDIRSITLRGDADTFLHIVHIPRSWRGPHLVADEQNPDSWQFPKRTNKGVEPMSYEEVRMAFSGYYERRRKLRLLREELRQLKVQSSTFIIGDEPRTALTPVASELPLAIVEAVISDSYLILEEDGGLLADLNQVRNLARQINHAKDQFYQELTRFGPGIEPDPQRKNYNLRVRIRIDTLQNTIDRCFEGIDRITPQM